MSARGGLIKFGGYTVGGRTLDFDCRDTSGEFEGMLEGFLGVDIGGYGPLGCFNVKAG